MRLLSLPLCIAAAVLALTPARMTLAQDTGGARVVVDPATGNVRVINPDYSAHNGSAPASGASVIHLHMPRAVHRKPAARPSAAQAPAATVSDTNGYGAPETNFPALSTPATSPTAKPATKAAAATPKAKPPPRLATATPPPAHITQAPGRRIHILFPPGAPAPAPGAAASLKSVAGILNSSLQNGSSRVQLEAYGGKPHDTSSEARRLSLRRALAVRQLLIDAGLPSSRIDVHALGGASDGGAPDRVDIFVHA
jgi:outer membrane protein OmpA-like peptidoglycan-associated protein